MKLSEISALRKKLEADFQRKIELNVSARSLDVTKQKLSIVNQALAGVKQSAGVASVAQASMFTKIGSVIGRFGPVGAILGMVSMGVNKITDSIGRSINAIFNYQDDLLDLATALGFNAELTRNLDYVMRMEGKTVNDMGMAFNTLYNKMQESFGGSKEAALAFDRLGVSVTNADGSMKDGQQVFLDTIDALHGMTDPTKRAMAAQDLFGRQWKDIIPLIERGTSGLKDAGDELDTFGNKLDPEAMKKHEEVTARWMAMWQGFKTRWAVPVMEGVDAVKEKLVALDKWMRDHPYVPWESSINDIGRKKEPVETIYQRAARLKKEKDEKGTAVVNPDFVFDYDLAKRQDEAAEKAMRQQEEADRMAEEVHQADMARVWGRAEEGQKRAKEGWALDNDLLAARKSAENKFYADMGWNARDLYEYRKGLIEAEAEAIRTTLGSAYADAWKSQKMSELPSELENLPSFVGPRRSQSGGKYNDEAQDFTKWTEDMKANIDSVDARYNMLFDSVESGMSAIWSNWAVFSEETINKTSNDFVRGMQIMVNAFEQAVLQMMAKYAALKAMGGLGSLLSGGLLGGVGGFVGKAAKWVGGLFSATGGEYEGTSSGVRKVASFAGGGDFIVPAGFNNDSFRLNVQTGEHVKVTPSGKIGAESKLLASINQSIQAQTMTMIGINDRVGKLEVYSNAIPARGLEIIVEKSQARSSRY
jgi:hypothetical protein